jgi:hypothetical protein
MELPKTTSIGWKKFADTEPGIRGLLWLNENQPVISKGPENEMLFDAGRVEGYRECLRRIEALQIVQNNIGDNADNPPLQ